MSQRRILTHSVRATHQIRLQCRHQSLIRPPTLRTLSTTQPQPQDDPTPGLLPLLQSRGLINQLAAPAPLLTTILSPTNKNKPAFYAGIDPTAPSLHLGHLLPLIILFWAAAHGFPAVSLVGGATARVGDPSGRLVSRERKGDDVVDGDAGRIKRQVGALWERAKGKLMKRVGEDDRQGWVEEKVLDNDDWLRRLSLVEFLGTMGRGVRVGAMLGRDTVRNKMEKGDGMSFAEFTYPLLQAWDWWHMYSTMNVQIQVGGSDQYGNIIAGIDAVRYLAQNEHLSTGTLDEARPPGSQPPRPWLDEKGRLKDDAAPMGLTVPLLTTSSGEKFGKSAGNAVWLNADMTSPFDLYGFLLRTPDADISRYLHLLTFLPLHQITEVMKQQAVDPGQRIAQHSLASEILGLVHGDDVAEQTRERHANMRNPSISMSGPGSTASGGDASVKLPRNEVVGVTWARVLQSAGMAVSRAEAARMMKGGSIYLATSAENAAHFEQIMDPRETVQNEHIVGGRLMVRVGKWKVRVIEVAEGEEKGETGSTR